MADADRPRRVAWPADEAGQARLLDEAVALLRGGHLVIFPTDTVYGVAADPDQPQAVAALFALKQRPPSKQVALLVAEFGQLAGRGIALPAVGQRLAERYWPGPLTLVLADPSGGTVGVRVPDHAIPLALLRRFGGPLATTSANRSSARSAHSADEVLAQLAAGYALLIDGGACPGGVDSTVIDLSATPPRVLRPGAIPRHELEVLAGPLAEG